MIRKLIRYAALATVVGLGVAACERAIATTNQVSGDTEKVIGTPDDAEALISTYYKRWSSGLYGSTTDIEGEANVMSLMNFSSLANNCQNNHFPFSGATNTNSPGNVCAGEQYRLYQILGEVDRVASNLLTQMDAKTNPLVLGNTDPTTDARDLRARSWAEFLRGISLGYIAMFYDSGGVVAPGMAGTDPGKLVPYTEVMDSAFAALQRAIDYAQPPGVTITNPSAGFPLPTTWYPRANPTSAAQFVQVIKSYRARFRANVARTPAERAAADWNKIIADAQGGITSDELLIASTTSGPNNAWRTQYDAFTTWHQMPPFFIGMADGGTNYATWLSQALTDRGAGNVGFFMVSPDNRFPQGGSRAAQQTDFAIAQCTVAATACKRYFINRSAANDQFSGPGWGWSNYDFVRFHSWVSKGDGSARNGATIYYALSELNLLQAEGDYRTGNYAGAAALINLTRATTTGNGGLYDLGGNLPAIGGTQTSVAPGGAACVPKVPLAGAAPTCGDLWETLKYEKRIETAYTAYANWFLDGRGWGDLPKDTPLFWAVPYQDLQARGRPISALYGTGPGNGNAPNSSAAVSVYGW